MPETLGRREKNKLERRRRLEDAAIELFERDGFEATTIEHITEVAGVAPRTFFSYFASKDDLVLADYAHRLGRIIGELEAQPDGKAAWDALRSAFAAVAVDYEVESDRLRQRFRIMLESPSVMARNLQLQAGWELAVADALRARPDWAANEAMPELLAASALAAMRASMQHWLTSGQPPALPELVQAAFARLGDGLARA